jgi:uncharacterized protein YecE (DUF72 family)
LRLHGWPRIYYSPYGEETLTTVAEQIVKETAAGAECWCIFDNTAAFAATHDALVTRGLVEARQ